MQDSSQHHSKPDRLKPRAGGPALGGLDDSRAGSNVTFADAVLDRSGEFVAPERDVGSLQGLTGRSRSGRGDGDTIVGLTVNGSAVPLPKDPRVSLLDLLRDYLQMPGTKKGCDQGACGACTVLVDGERILSCLGLAVQFQGREIRTIEALDEVGVLHPLQQAFIEQDGLQCGYCTPGQICSAVAMVEEVRRAVPSYVTRDVAANDIVLDRDELRERMSGNLCRCGAYNGIIDAILSVYGVEAT